MAINWRKVFHRLWLTLSGLWLLLMAVPVIIGWRNGELWDWLMNGDVVLGTIWIFGPPAILWLLAKLVAWLFTQRPT